MSLTPDTPAPAAGDSLWISISQLALHKNVTKQTISERVARLADDGKLEIRPGKGKAKLVNLAEYDRAVGETTDLSREQGARTKAGDEPGPASRDPTFTQHQATRAGYEAELKRLDLEERLGRLRPVEEIEAAAIECGAAVVNIVGDKVLRAEELAAAVAKDGIIGARRLLKDIVFAEREQIAKAFSVLAAGAAAETEEVEVETQ
jgi:hypothetical protein